LLRDAHPAPELPPRFQDSVWHRIERGRRGAADREAAGGRLERFVRGLLRPAVAGMALAAVMLAGRWFGIRDGAGRADRADQARYLASVSPFHRSPP
jgi:hypothetical protein